jgi:hypothetical protein
VLATDAQQDHLIAGCHQQQRALGGHPSRREIVMNPIHYIRRIAAVLAALAAAVVAFATTPAFATDDPPAGGGAVAPHLAPVHAVIAGGMPGWQITLIAAGAALLTATLAVLLDRARATRRNPVIAAA